MDDYSDDLRSLLIDNDQMVNVRFDDDHGNQYSAWLITTEKIFRAAVTRPDCPQQKYSLEYYDFLLAHADAVHAHPNDWTPPLIRRDDKGTITAAYYFFANKNGVIAFQSCDDDDLVNVRLCDNMFFMDPKAWRDYCARERMRKLPSPHRPLLLTYRHNA